MSVSYKREINHNYLIIDSSEQAASGYECRMLAGNTIEGLLKFRVRYHEDKKEFYYEITSKQPLSRILEQRMITGREIRALILGISGVLSRLEEFLLKEEQILLEPDYIYIEPDGFSVFVCMVPGYAGDFPSALTALLEYLLSKVNHQDREGVMLAYNLYHESLKENYGMEDLLKLLSEKNRGIFEEDKREERRDERRDERWEERREERRDERWEEKREERFEKDDRNITAFEGVIQSQVLDKEPKQERKHRAQKVKRPDITGKTVGSSILRWLFRTLGLSVAGMAGIWFLTGREGLYLYGGWVLAGAVILSGLASISSHFFLSADKADIASEIENNPNYHVEREEKYKVVQEEKADHWTDWKESDKMEIAVEPQTTLLAELDKPEQLAVMEGLNREQGSIEITYLPFVIGKNEELSDYCLRQPTVSRLHLRVDKKEDVFIVTDLNSTNGTTVEGYHLQANETVSIKNGDIIFLADAGFRFVEMKL